MKEIYSVEVNEVEFMAIKILAKAIGDKIDSGGISLKYRHVSIETLPENVRLYNFMIDNTIRFFSTGEY